MRQRTNECPRLRSRAVFLNCSWVLVLVAVWLGGSLFAEDSPPIIGFAQLLEKAPVAAWEAGDDTEAPKSALNVSGRILDSAGQPIVDAFVALTHSSGLLARTRSDAEGGYRFDEVLCLHPDLSRPDRDGSVTLAKIVAADVDGRLNWEPIKYFVFPKSNGQRDEFLPDGPIPESLFVRQNLSLDESNALTGVILDSVDAPVADVQVTLPILLKPAQSAGEMDDWFAAIGTLETTSDEEGKFRFPKVPGGMVAGLMLKHADHRIASAHVSTRPGETDISSEHTRFAMERISQNPARLNLVESVTLPEKIVAADPIEIHGQVIASDDQKPVADLPLKIESLRTGRPSLVETQTDQEGRFTVKASVGRWLITCGPKPGFNLLANKTRPSQNMSIDPKSQRIVDLIEPGQPTHLGIIIDRMPVVTVKVVDPDGQPAAGAKVSFWRISEPRSTFTRRSSGQSIVPDGLTDSRGVCKFQLPTLLDENWVVMACSPAVTPQWFAFEQLRSIPRRPVELQLVPGIPVRGRVLLDGSPLAGAEVRLAEQFFPGGKDDPNSRISTVTTNATGEYELFLPTSAGRGAPQVESSCTVALTRIPEFTHCPRSTHSVSTRTSENTTRDALAAKDFNVVTARGTASGRVIDESGAPIEGAIVRASSSQSLFGDVRKQAYATTDESGGFHWVGMGAVKFRPVVVIHGKRTSPKITIEAGQDSIEIVVP